MTNGAAAPDYKAWLSLDGRGYVVLGAGEGIGRVRVAVEQRAPSVVAQERVEHGVGRECRA